MNQKTENKSKTLPDLLKAQAESLELFRFTNYRDYLSYLYQELKTADPHYSYKAMAEDLGFPPGNVIWLILTGRRKISPMGIKRLVESLQFKNEHRRYLIALIKQNNANKLEVREVFFREMLAIKTTMIGNDDPKQDVLEYFSEWYYPVIREMIGLPHFNSDPNWIAHKLLLKILPKQAESALRLLERLGLIKFDPEKQRHVQLGGQVKLTGDVQAHALTRYHEKMCDLAREAIARVPAKERDFNTLTLRLTDAKAEKIQALLLELCKTMFEMESFEGELGSSIYQINTQIFPIVKKED